MEPIILDLPEQRKRTWYLKTGIMNSILHRNDTQIKKEKNLLNQLRERHQFLVVRLPNNYERPYKKVTIPVKLNGKVKNIDEIAEYIENNNIELLDEEVVIIEEAYNEWLELYNKANIVNPQIQPIHTIAEPITNLAETKPISDNNVNNTKWVLPVAKALPTAYKIGRGKKTKVNKQKSNSRKKRTIKKRKNIR